MSWIEIVGTEKGHNSFTAEWNIYLLQNMWWKPPTGWKHENQLKKPTSVVQKNFKLGPSIECMQICTHTKEVYMSPKKRSLYANLHLKNSYENDKYKFHVH